MSLPPASSRPLIVRLRNWVGDVVLGLPALERLQQAGFAIELLGKGWAADLLAGHGWPVHPLPAARGERIALLNRLGRSAKASDPGFTRRVNAVCFPFSFGSALEMRLAGLRAIGHAGEARSWLLARALPRLEGADRPHELVVYWQLASALLGTDAPLPRQIGLRSTPAHRAQAQALLEAHGIGEGFVVLCPFAGGTFAGQDKTWPGFAEFAAAAQAAFGRPVLVVPGPGEEAAARQHFSGCIVLEGVKLGTYAALLRRAALMVSNDTGPGHLAAAVGTPVVSVLGPSDPRQWRAWGPQVSLVQGAAPGRWPELQAVLAHAGARLAEGAAGHAG